MTRWDASGLARSTVPVGSGPEVSERIASTVLVSAAVIEGSCLASASDSESSEASVPVCGADCKLVSAVFRQA